MHDLLYNPVDFQHVIATAEKSLLSLDKAAHIECICLIFCCRALKIKINFKINYTKLLIDLNY